jgi:prepilin-type processing-associated H-X9-DG protein
MNSTHYKLISKSKATCAFTFVELLVVIATLGVLVIMLLPALAKTGPNTQAFQCLNNLRQIQDGWLVYSSDNNDRIVPTVGQGAIQVSLLPDGSGYTQPGNPENQWIYGDVSKPTPIDPNLIKLGLIFPYVQNVAAFKCPADVRTVFGWGVTQPPGASNPLTIRSISMNGYMSPIVDKIQTSTAPLNQAYRIFRKQSDLAVMGAANCWVLLDENPYSINDSWFVADPSPTASSWIDKPATYHNNSCGLSFADGHCELHKWRDANLIAYKGGQVGNIQAQAGVGDITWLGQRTSILK